MKSVTSVSYQIQSTLWINFLKETQLLSLVQLLEPERANAKLPNMEQIVPQHAQLLKLKLMLF